MERFYEDTTTDLGQQLGFMKAQLRGDGNHGSQLALEDLSALRGVAWVHCIGFGSLMGSMGSMGSMGLGLIYVCIDVCVYVGVGVGGRSGGVDVIVVCWVGRGAGGGCFGDL